MQPRCSQNLIIAHGFVHGSLLLQKRRATKKGTTRPLAHMLGHDLYDSVKLSSLATLHEPSRQKMKNDVRWCIPLLQSRSIAMQNQNIYTFSLPNPRTLSTKSGGTEKCRMAENSLLCAGFPSQGITNLDPKIWNRSRLMGTPQSVLF